MWKNTRIKRGFISLVLIMLLVLTSLSPAILWADEDTGEVQAVTTEGTQAITNEEETQKSSAESTSVVENQTVKDLDWNDSYIQGKVEVSQKDNPDAETTLELNKDFSVKMTVKFPVSALDNKGNPRDYLAKDAKIRIPLASGVKVVKSITGKVPATITDENENKTIIENAFEAETVSDKNRVFMVMTLLRDSKEFGDVFDVSAEIRADFSINKENIPEAGNVRYITILEKQFSVIGDIQSKFEMKKTGKIDFNNGKIDWIVGITHKGEDGSGKSLEGFKFEDPIENVGNYVDRSFKLEALNGDTITIEETALTEVEDLANSENTIAYVFPKDAPSEVKIKFSTVLEDLQSSFVKNNTAYLYAKDGNQNYAKVFSAEGEVKWSGRWGVKYEGTFSEKSGIIKGLLENELKASGSSITEKDLKIGDSEESKKIVDGKYKAQWNIVFDATGKNLDNVTFEDIFPIKETFSKEAELSFTSATMYIWDNPTKSWVKKDITDDFKNGNSYFIEHLNTVVKISIWSEVEAAKIKGSGRFSNFAYFKWNDKQVRLIHDMDLGEEIFIKGLNIPRDDKYVEANPEWSIMVSKDYVEANAKEGDIYVYDAVIYDADIDVNLLEGSKEGLNKFSISGDGKLASGIDLPSVIHMASNRKMVYEEGSCKGIVPKVYTLKYDGREVGHLLEFNLSKCTQIVTKKSKDYYKVSFKTHLVDADIITGGFLRDGKNPNSKNQIFNRAFLVKGATGLEAAKWELRAEYWANYNYRMIQKDALTSEAAEKIINKDYSEKNANAVITDKYGAYNKENKSIIYRLSVNAANVKSVIKDKKYMEALIKDSIDNKFEMVDINKEVPYLVYRGDARTAMPTTDAYVEAKGEKFSKNDANAIFTVDEKERNIAAGDKLKTVFRFNKLEEPYVILYRAQLKDENIKKNEAGTINNTATFTACNESKSGAGAKYYDLTSGKEVSYDSKYLIKDYTEDKGIVRWKIVYNPFMLDKAAKEALENGSSVELLDELDKGLTVIKKDGKLNFTENAYELYKTDKNGKKTGDYTNLLKDWLKYERKGDKDTLTLKIPETERLSSFVFEYDTVLADGLGEINNTVKIIADNKQQGQAETKTYKVKAGVTVTSVKEGNKTDIPNPDPDPNPGSVVPPTPNESDIIIPPDRTPQSDIPTYPADNTPNPEAPDSPDEFVAVDEDGTPQGRYVKQKRPDGGNEYVKVDEDNTPQGVKLANNLPKTGGTNTVVYYAGGVMFLMLAAGVMIKRKRDN